MNGEDPRAPLVRSCQDVVVLSFPRVSVAHQSLMQRVAGVAFHMSHFEKANPTEDVRRERDGGRRWGARVGWGGGAAQDSRENY